MSNLKQELKVRRDALRKSLADELSHLSDLREPTRGDSVDWALDALNGELSSQIAESESRKLAKIEEALSRMERGSYGVCDVCAQKIPAARLEALPDSTMCVQCQREDEASGSKKRFVVPHHIGATPGIAAEIESDVH